MNNSLLIKLIQFTINEEFLDTKLKLFIYSVIITSIYIILLVIVFVLAMHNANVYFLLLLPIIFMIILIISINDLFKERKEKENLKLEEIKIEKEELNIKLKEIEKEITITLKTLFEIMLNHQTNSELFANFHKLKTFFNVIKNDNQQYIVFGNINSDMYIELYNQFCTLTQDVLWTKNNSFLNTEEILKIFRQNKIKKYSKISLENMDDLEELGVDFTTKYDEMFLKSKGIKRRILIVEKVEDSAFKNSESFCKMLGTDEEAVDFFNNNIQKLKKRIIDFKGDSELYIIEKQELVNAYKININKLEFGVYHIGNSLFILKTEKVLATNNSNYHVTVEVQKDNYKENLTSECEFYDTLIKEENYQIHTLDWMTEDILNNEDSKKIVSNFEINVIKSSPIGEL